MMRGQEYESVLLIVVFCFIDLFEKMVPMAVQQALAVYNQRKADLVNRSIGQMREATNLANG